ncbi:MAG: TrmO family methyltransferase [Chloroflexi bacterium]|nr:TrmO family methyltransferase [Chloroflexota bacterium]
MAVQINHDEIISIIPIGIIRNTFKKEEMINLSRSEIQQKVESLKRQKDSTIIINDEFAEALDGIDNYSHLVIIFWAHLLSPEERFIKKVNPRGRLDQPLKGIFATCSPARPNPKPYHEDQHSAF